MTIAETILADALDIAAAALSPSNMQAGIELATRRVAFVALTAPVLAGLLAESVNGTNSNQWRVAWGEMMDAIEGSGFEVQAIQLAAERVILTGELKSAAQVTVSFITNAALKVGVAAAIALL